MLPADRQNSDFQTFLTGGKKVLLKHILMKGSRGSRAFKAPCVVKEEQGIQPRR
jgi:hypothetical protein